MKTIYLTNELELSKKAAYLVLEKIKLLAAKQETVVLALCGGRSVETMFKEFAKSNHACWKKTHIFMIDERVVDIHSTESNYKMVFESFADTLVKQNILPVQNLHPFIMDEQAVDFGASKYSEILKKYGGKFDVVVIGSGEDGHIAALFPEHNALKHETGYVYLNDSPKPPPKRVTASKSLIRNAGHVFLFFVGDGKKSAYSRFLDPKVREEDCPSKIAIKSKDLVVVTNLETNYWK